MENKSTHKLLQMILEHVQSDRDSEEVAAFQSPSQLVEKLNLELGENPLPENEIEEFCKNYLNNAVKTQSPGFGNQLWSKVDDHSLVGEWLSSATNTSMYTYEVAPVATILEHKMIEKLTNLVWSKKGDGIMTSGGTASNLQALMCARNKLIPSARTSGLEGMNPVIFCSESAHYSISRAANILGIGTDNCISIKVNENQKMDVEDLWLKVNEQVERGKIPICVVATAGTTVFGVYDSIDKIAEVCEQYNMWLHVDGAFGANVLLSDQHKSLMLGVGKADSLSWDFHKAMGVHLPCAFLLCREKESLKSALHKGGDNYIFHSERSEYEDLGPSSLQCGRRVDILKLWLTWQHLGRKGLQERVNQLFSSAKLLEELIEQNPKLDFVAQPESINVCFRYLSNNSKTGVEPKIRQVLMDRGLRYINFSRSGSDTFFRMAITRPDLDETYFKQTLSMICEIGGQLESNGN